MGLSDCPATQASWIPTKRLPGAGAFMATNKHLQRNGTTTLDVASQASPSVGHHIQKLRFPQGLFKKS
jgi:hypothetical protein